MDVVDSLLIVLGVDIVFFFDFDLIMMVELENLWCE